MSTLNADLYKDISERTDGAVFIGVVGPVRTGKSTFIKRFMESLVIPGIDDVYMRERAKDELPQSGSGKTIMTSEPKFVPEDAVQVNIDENVVCSVRLIDCVGYMINGASGQFEDGLERMVTTPWFDHEVSITQAAEAGTSKVINEHSTIGIVVTTDGSICDIPRNEYVEAEKRVVNELKSIGKPFVVLLNSAFPESHDTLSLADELSESYEVPCLPVNCLELGANEINGIMQCVLNEFPVNEIRFWLPDWVDTMNDDFTVKRILYEVIINKIDTVSKVSDIQLLSEALEENECIECAGIENADMGKGIVDVRISTGSSLYYETVSAEAGEDIRSDGELMNYLKKMRLVKMDYDNISEALDNARNTGYGVVLPNQESINLDEPKIVRQAGKYTVKLRASGDAIHMLKTGVVAEITPALGRAGASDDILGFLLQGLDGDMSKLWESNIFGKSINDMAVEAINNKLNNIPSNARGRLQETLQRITNEGNGTLICILL